MYVEQLYTGCLAEAAYYIESNGEAAVIDPLRETEPYLHLAELRGAKIKYVMETHFHADFVSGHLDLAKKAGGAQIVYGPGAKANYDIYVAKDGEELPLGNVKIRVLHTPGHTMESSCFLLLDEHGKEYAIFTGDTLFVGDVGRPDLAVKTDLSREDLAGHLFDSIQNKILPLPDEVILYPGHGAGSQCGKNLGKERYSTIGEQKRVNYALQYEDKQKFIDAITEGLTAPPQYFPKNAMINKSGYEDIDVVMARNTHPLSLADFEQFMVEGALVLDTRNENEFAEGYIPNALNVPLDGSYAVWVGTLIEDLGTPMVLITPPDREEESILRLARVGYENVRGYLKGGFDAWKEAGKKVETITNMPAEKFKALREKEDVQVLDVRNLSEFEGGHLAGATFIPLAELPGRMKEVNPDKMTYVHCKAGYRAMIAISMLKQHGYTQVANIKGGMDAIQEANIPLVQPSMV